MKVKEQGLYLPEFEHDNCGAGFICNLNGIKSNDIIHKALDILIKLEHRGESADGRTGDGAGILLIFLMIFFMYFTIPKRASMQWNGFLPKRKTKLILQDDFETAIRNQNLNIIGWRCSCRCFKSWTNRSRKEPIIKQVFIGKLRLTEQQFNAKLFAARLLNILF
jgi:glutamate synthase (ferredoxin)